MSWVTICWRSQINFCISLFSHTEGLKFSKILVSRCLEYSASSWLSLYLWGKRNKKKTQQHSPDLLMGVPWLNPLYILYFAAADPNVFLQLYDHFLSDKHKHSPCLKSLFAITSSQKKVFSPSQYGGTQRRPSPPILEGFLSAVVSRNSGIFLQLI